jgi:hypothetical protein
MLVDYDSLVNELSSVLSKCRLTAHRARVKALSTLLQGLLLLCEASLSGMGRGATLLDEQKTFSGQLKRAFRFLNNPQFDPWEVGNALFGRLTQGLKRVLIAVDWTQVGDFMILEATFVVAGRGIPFLSLSVPKSEIKGPLKSPGAEHGVCPGRHEEARTNLIYPGGSGVCGTELFRPFGALSVDAEGNASQSHDDFALG